MPSNVPVPFGTAVQFNFGNARFVVVKMVNAPLGVPPEPLKVSEPASQFAPVFHSPPVAGPIQVAVVCA